MAIVRLFHVEKKWRQTAPGVRELVENEVPVTTLAVPKADPNKVDARGTLHPDRRGAESVEIKARKDGTFDMNDNQIEWALHHGLRVRSADGKIAKNDKTPEA